MTDSSSRAENAGDGDVVLASDERFSVAVCSPLKSKVDLAFVMHLLAWLADNGTTAIVCFPGFMYRGGGEKQSQMYLVAGNFLDCVIALSDNLFYGTSIAGASS